MEMNSRLPVHGGLTPPAFILDEDFLAPRGLCLHDEHLVVADTASNRVRLFRKGSSAFMPVLTLGGAGNGREGCDAGSFQYPSGVWTDGRVLIVADAWNHRVLVWKRMPGEDAAPADVVIGQPDFLQHEVNRRGLGAPPTADSLYWPYGVWSDGRSLWISDTGNRRILYYEKIPSVNGAAATAVIGQEGFGSRDYDPANAIWPYSVKVSRQGEMLVADTQYHRCLYWRDWKDALTMPADHVIGQPDMEGNGANRFRLKPSAETLNWCYDACFAGSGILVADTGNSRILHFGGVTADGQMALALTGQSDFDSNGEASLSMKSTEDHSRHLYWPFSVSHSGGMLAVADTGKSRILVYELNPSV